MRTSVNDEIHCTKIHPQFPADLDTFIEKIFIFCAVITGIVENYSDDILEVNDWLKKGKTIIKKEVRNFQITYQFQACHQD